MRVQFFYKDFDLSWMTVRRGLMLLRESPLLRAAIQRVDETIEDETEHFFNPVTPERPTQRNDAYLRIHALFDFKRDLQRYLILSRHEEKWKMKLGWELLRFLPVKMKQYTRIDHDKIYLLFDEHRETLAWKALIYSIRRSIAKWINRGFWGRRKHRMECIVRSGILNDLYLEWSLKRDKSS